MSTKYRSCQTSDVGLSALSSSLRRSSRPDSTIPNEPADGGALTMLLLRDCVRDIERYVDSIDEKGEKSLSCFSVDGHDACFESLAPLLSRPHACMVAAGEGDGVWSSASGEASSVTKRSPRAPSAAEPAISFTPRPSFRL